MRNKNKPVTVFIMVLVSAALMMLSGCGRSDSGSVPAEPAQNNEAISLIESGESSDADEVIERQDGERFEEVIILEGMEETVKYEHVRNELLGFEMDYDYELFERQRESDRDRFLSLYDAPDDPQNYLEVTYSTEDADAVSASISEALSEEYDIIREPFMLERAGSCIRIDASEAKGGMGTPDLLQMVYIIPAPDGCRVAAAHYSFESAEGFGRRFAYFMNAFAVIPVQGK